MYRSLAHQCELKDLNALIDNKSSLEAHIVLRQKAADHIAAHPDDFMPFILDDSGVAPAEQLEKYCRNLKDTATWGSQVELQALAAALRIQIQVRCFGAVCILKVCTQRRPDILFDAAC